MFGELNEYFGDPSRAAAVDIKLNSVGAVPALPSTTPYPSGGGAGLRPEDGDRGLRRKRPRRKVDPLARMAAKLPHETREAVRELLAIADQKNVNAQRQLRYTRTAHNRTHADQRHCEQYARKLELQLQNAHTRIQQLELKVADLKDCCSALSGSTRCQTCGGLQGVPRIAGNVR